MTNKWRTIFKVSGLALLVTGIFIKLPPPWPIVIGFLGLGMFLAAGGSG